MKVVFRTDASNQIGIGHIMRCLTLAKVLEKNGVDISFICRAYPGNLVDLLKRESVLVTVLPSPDQQAEETGAEDHAVWLGVTQAEDAEQTIEALKGEKPDWLVVDRYGIDSDWEQALHPYVGNILVVDDLANAQHDCDLLLNQNYIEGVAECYKGLLPKNCRLLLGPSFALLKPAYANYRQTLRPYGGEDVQRVLIFFGGSDQRNISGLALEALFSPELMHLEVDVVIGANNLHKTELEKQASERPLTNIYGPRSYLADLMVQADIVIGAGGTTTWERMCLGLPAIVVSTCENQRSISESLSQAGLIHYVGEYSAVRAADLTQAVKELIENHDRMLELSTLTQRLVDGLGVLRLAEVLNPTPKDKLWMRKASSDDVILYFNWVNEPEVRCQSFHRDFISWAEHKVWFDNKLVGSNSFLFVLMAETLPVGQIRFDLDGGEAQIDYSLDPLVRGRGWGSQLVDMGCRLMKQHEPCGIRAEVKAENPASRAVFMSLGFKLTESERNDGYISFCLDRV